MPILEAIINSVHSIEDHFGAGGAAEKGRIELHVRRVAQLPLPGLSGKGAVEPVECFEIVDNGIGFDDPNLESFRTADGRFKRDRGGKGIGRLTWLVVFERAEIESRFSGQDSRLHNRSFTFSSTGGGISGFSDDVLNTEVPVETHVRLVGVQKQFSEPLRKRLAVIADRVIEHCFNYLVVGNCPRITVFDHGSGGSSSVVVNELVENLSVIGEETLMVERHGLCLRHIQWHHASGRKHLGHLLADGRVVKSFPLTDVCDLGPNPFRNEQGELSVHHVLVEGPALDSAVDATRTDFNLPDGEPIQEAGGLLDLKTLREQIGRAVNEQLRDVLETERKQNLSRIEHHIRTKQPEYARLLDRKQDALSRIKWTGDPMRDDLTLYKLKQNWEIEIRTEQALVEKALAKGTADPTELADRLFRVVEETNQVGKDDLVRYVLKRRAVLQVLSSALSKSEGSLEKDIHRVVFPLRTTNGEIDYRDHNLWLIDDTLAFYEFVSSEVSLRSNPTAPSDSLERPDIVAFKTGDPFQHISIVEFKRPDRTDSENPVSQLARYGRRLRDGGSMDANGVTLPGVPKSVRIDGYAIVTLSPKMESILRDGPAEMSRVENEWRWHGAMRNLNMYVEVLDYRAFLTRAQQRNQAFFNALNLSSSGSGAGSR